MFCASYFALGGWLTYVALQSGGSLPTSQNSSKAGVQASVPVTDSWTGGDLSPDGFIEAVKMPFSHPNGVFPDRSLRLKPERWEFKGLSEEQMVQLLESCDLRRQDKDALLNRQIWTKTPGGLALTPPAEVIWSMSSAARSRIYSVLARDSDNYPQFNAWQFDGNGLDLKFRCSGLQTSTIEAVRRLTYTNEGWTCFADLRALQLKLATPEFDELTETLCAVPAFLLRLHVKENANVDALISYWGRGGREKLISPMINTLARMPGGGQINVSYLLPPYARLRLYTYPDDWNDHAPLQDCTFTALNFFNDKPDARLFDMAYREKCLNNEYTVVRDKPGFGDVVTLLNSNNVIFHSCVYIVDGFVFTKNGINPEQPWIIMRFPDMLATYQDVEKTARIEFRRRLATSAKTVAAK